MKIVACEQGSQEWLEARCGIPTASEFDSLVTPLWAVKEGKAVDTYLYRKLAEAWAGPIIDKTSFAMDQGNILEDIGIPWYEFETGEQIERVGLVTTDDGRIGCSPDGLLPDGGIELKCPERPNHVRYLLGGKLPSDYKPQVQGCMFVTGREWWKFVSFNRNFPPLILTIGRDKKAQAAIKEALDSFIERFDAAWKRLVEINEGPPPKREPMVFSHEIRQADTEDVLQ